MDSRYSYDEDQQVWPFFAATILGCVLIPFTISRLSSVFSKAPVTERPGYSARLSAYDSKKKKAGYSGWFILLGWIIMAALVNVIRNIDQVTDEARFDPWELLNIARSATEKEAKSAYRKLSLKFHPDKVHDLGEMTLEEVEDRYVQLTKAYKALTDEVTRENFLKYGHPDGPQSQVLGIALPKFLIEGGTPILALVYLLIGIGAPLLAARWWRIQSSRNRQGLLQTTASTFFLMCSQEQLQFLGPDEILQRIAECDDFEDSKTPSERLEIFNSHFSNRESSSDPHTIAVAVKLLQGLHSIAFEFKNFEFCRRVTELQRCFVVAVPPSKIYEAEKLQQPTAATNYKIPKLHMLSAFFKNPGMDVVAPGSVPHLVIRLLVVPPGATKIPAIDNEVLGDNPIDHADIKLLRDPLSSNKRAPAIPVTESLYFPTSEEFVPKWNAYIYGDMERIISQPVAIEHLDLSNLNLTPEQFASGDGVVVSTFKIMLGGPLPAQLVKIPLKLALLSTGYFGCDVRERVIVEIKNPPSVSEATVEEDEDEEEDEEDEDESDLSDIDTDTEDESEVEVKK